jgi:hypothetical protein
MRAKEMLSYRKLLAVLIAILALVLTPTPFFARDSSIAVVVNLRNTTKSISMTELRNIFLGTQQFWKDGTQVVPVVHAPSSRERDVLLRRVVHMSEAQFQQYWNKKHSGRPMVVVSNGMQMEIVSKEAGGIALVAPRDVRSGVNVLRVDGHLPGSAAYPLKTSVAR